MSKIQCVKCKHTLDHEFKTTDTISTNGRVRECPKCGGNMVEVSKGSSSAGKPAKAERPAKPEKSDKPVNAWIAWISQAPVKVLPTMFERGTHKSGGKSDKERPEPPELTAEEVLASVKLDPAQVKLVAKGIVDELADAQKELDADEDDEVDDSLPIRSPSGEKRPANPRESAASARQRLAAEEERLARDKHLAKVDKTFGKLQMPNQAKEVKPDLSVLDRVKRYASSSPKKEKSAKSEITKAREAEEAGKSSDKYFNALMTGEQYASKAGVILAKGIGKGLGPASSGDDIASAALGIAATLGAIGQDLLVVYRALGLYFNDDVENAKKSQCRSVALAALGGVAGDLVVLTKHTLNVAEGSGALEAGSAVPILGIVAAVPGLVLEINRLRSAITREAKQRKIHGDLKKQGKDGTLDPSLQAVDVALKSFIAADNDVIAKGIAKVCLDFAKIAGHGVTLGGITAPVGVGLAVGAVGGKLLITAVGKGQAAYAAHEANEGRKTGDTEREIKNDPQLAAQVVLDQALRDGPGSQAFLIAKSFGIKSKQLRGVIEAPDSAASLLAVRDMRQKMLFKLDAKDETPETLYRQGKRVVDGAKAFLSKKEREEEIVKYREAKNLLRVGGKGGRGKGWDMMRVVTKEIEDVEEQKRVLLEAFELRMFTEPVGLDPEWVQSIRGLLAPRVLST